MLHVAFGSVAPIAGSLRVDVFIYKNITFAKRRENRIEKLQEKADWSRIKL
jgi:hypothetical protein